MTKIQFLFPAFLALCGSASLVNAQAITVIGGNNQARDCHRNATMSSSLPQVSKNMLEPCDYALEKVRLIPRDRASTYTNRGILLAARGELDEALQSYEQALVITPDTGEIFVNRGNVWFEQANYTMAMDDYQQALALGIRQMHALHYNLALVWEKLGNRVEAEQAYRTALSLKPDWTLAQQRLNLLLNPEEE
jgi:tetratricopeptide (TPR) repeat protein